ACPAGHGRARLARARKRRAHRRRCRRRAGVRKAAQAARSRLGGRLCRTLRPGCRPPALAHAGRRSRRRKASIAHGCRSDRALSARGIGPAGHAPGSQRLRARGRRTARGRRSAGGAVAPPGPGMIARGIRLTSIALTLARYRLDELLTALPPLRFARAARLLPWGRRHVRELTRGARLRLALQELGPIYVKFGQILSTRRDLLPEDIA